MFLSGAPSPSAARGGDLDDLGKVWAAAGFYQFYQIYQIYQIVDSEYVILQCVFGNF